MGGDSELQLGEEVRATKTPKNKGCGRKGGYVFLRPNGSESTSFHIDGSPLGGDVGVPLESIKKLGGGE